MILTKYALDHNFNIYNYYIDDGFTGTSFNRPGFKQLINDIESGLIDIVITKDLSRLGRDYLESGKYIERFFPEHNIRYIAINDMVDTSKDENTDIIP
ncbi:MAG: recombinase family protein [Clostridia bacterium]|nr:recombinase family protein [Clostridia bacterium]